MCRIRISLVGEWRIFPFLLLAIVISGCAGRREEHPKAPSTANMESGQDSQASHRALSLKILAERAQASVRGGVFPEEVLHLAGLTQITGYVVDRQNADIVLIGREEPGAPPLHLDDLVIALRSAWHLYAEERGGVRYITPPGVTIDPDPTVMHTLNQVKARAFRSGNPQAIDAGLKTWKRIAESPQRARILGLPPCRMAKIALEADYDMKRVVDGSARLDIPGFVSLSEMRWRILENDLRNGRQPSVARSSFNRFWFAAGRMTFLEDEDVVQIREAPVTLKTEEEVLVSQSKIAGRGRSDPLAKRFCEVFTKEYTAVAGHRTIYRELENMFRWVALAQIMRTENASGQSGMLLDFLLNEYPVNKLIIPATLPGIASVRRVNTKRGSSDLYQWSMTCGGVDLGGKLSEDDVLRDTSGKLRSFAVLTLQSRPNPVSLSWVVSFGT